MEDEMFTFYRNALLGRASEKPLCEEYKNEWRACGNDKDKLMKFAMRQSCLPFIFTYSYKGEGLSKEYLMQEFGEYINGKRTILDADGVQGYTYALNVGLQHDCAIMCDITSFMYCKEINVIIPCSKCPTLYVACGSHLHLSLDGFSNIRVHLYDDSKVTIYDADVNNTVNVYRYSDNVQVERGKYCFCNVKEMDKDLRLQM